MKILQRYFKRHCARDVACEVNLDASLEKEKRQLQHQIIDLREKFDALQDEFNATKSLYERQMDKGKKAFANEKNETAKRKAIELQLESAERVNKQL